MKITSNAFTHNEMIPQQYTCEGKNIFPPFTIFDPPPNVKSFVMLMHDHDAQSGDFVHWLMWNIGPLTHEITENTLPVGAIEGTNDFGQVGWSGPCPPSGMHRYKFHLFALDTMLKLPTISKKENIRDAIIGRVLEEASITGLYEKTL